MTFKDLQNVPHLSIVEEIPDKFCHIHAEDGYVITTWNDGDDIKDYDSCQCYYMPLTGDYIDVHTISVADDETLRKQKEIAIQIEEKKEEE